MSLLFVECIAYHWIVQTKIYEVYAFLVYFSFAKLDDSTFLFVLKQLFYKSLKYLLYACVRIQSYQNCLLVKIITQTILMTWGFLFIRCMLVLTARDRPTKLSASPILLSGVGAVISAHPVCRPTAYCYSIFVHITQRDRTLDSLENI